MNSEFTHSEPGFNAFAPLVLLAASIMVLLIWNLVAVVQQRGTLARVHDQQTQHLEQAAGVEMKLKAIVADLVTLSGEDADAAAIVKKFGISFNQGPAQSPTPSPREATPAVTAPSAAP